MASFYEKERLRCQKPSQKTSPNYQKPRCVFGVCLKRLPDSVRQSEVLMKVGRKLGRTAIKALVRYGRHDACCLRSLISQISAGLHIADVI